MAAATPCGLAQEVRHQLFGSTSLQKLQNTMFGSWDPDGSLKDPKHSSATDVIVQRISSKRHLRVDGFLAAFVARRSTKPNKRTCRELLAQNDSMLENMVKCSPPPAVVAFLSLARSNYSPNY